MIELDEGKYAKYLEGPKTKKGKSMEFNKIKVARKAYNLEVKSFKKKAKKMKKKVKKRPSSSLSYSS